MVVLMGFQELLPTVYPTVMALCMQCTAVQPYVFMFHFL